MDIQQSLIERIRLADRRGANALLDGWAAEHSYEDLLTEVLDPVLEEIGLQWRDSRTLTLSQTYVAAKVAEDIMSKIAERSRANVRR